MKKKGLGITQQTLAKTLHVSFQAISKWETGVSYPDIELLPILAKTLNISIDSLLGYPSQSVTEYDNHYSRKEYYWGLEPNRLCYEIMQRKPPIKPYKVLDIGCGEGKDELQVDIRKSGELFSYYHDRMFHKSEEVIFDCNSNGVLHKHCKNVLIAEKVI